MNLNQGPKHDSIKDIIALFLGMKNARPYARMKRGRALCGWAYGPRVTYQSFPEALRKVLHLSQYLSPIGIGFLQFSQ